MAEDTPVSEVNWDLFRADLRVPRMTIARPRPVLAFDIPIRKRPRLLGPGDGPPPPRIDLQLVHDSNAFIADKIILPSGPFIERGLADPRQRRAYYIIGWPDLPAARTVIDCAKALDYVSPRTLEDWEYQTFLHKEAEKEELEREAREAAVAAVAARAEGKSMASVQTLAQVTMKKKKKKPGRSQKHQILMGRSPPTPQLNSEQEEMLAKRKHGPSLSTPQKSRIAQLDAEMHILETLGESIGDGGDDDEKAQEKAEEALQLQFEAGLSSDASACLGSEVADAEARENGQSSPDTPQQLGSVSVSLAGSATPDRRKQPALPGKAESVARTSPIHSKSSTRAVSTNLARSPASRPQHRPIKTPLSKSVSTTTMPPQIIPHTIQGKPSSSRSPGRLHTVPSIEKPAVTIPSPAASLPAAANAHSGFTTTNSFTPVGETFPQPPNPLKQRSPQRPAEQRALPSSNGTSHWQNLQTAHQTKTPKLDPPSHPYRHDASFDSVEIHVAEEPEEEQEYVVKRLEGDQLLDGVHWFQVRWEGSWPEGQNPTWEPKDNIPANLVKRYLKRKAKKAAEAELQQRQKQRKSAKKSALHASRSTSTKSGDRRSQGGSLPPPAPELRRQSTLEQWARTYSSVSEAFESPAELYDSAVLGKGSPRPTNMANHTHVHSSGNSRGRHVAGNADLDMAIASNNTVVHDENDDDDGADELFVVDSKTTAQELEAAAAERKRSLGSQFAAQFGRRMEF
ncbi:hypothetical protein BD289DRAFT_429087 [Coniella lustricola]|uniref:Chromo domain-containing protein n=1 Tax=Coniella lustricola TaxID=2025994 RepID=A0A2T3AD73_9PEZI|nr:hypothetical protein BD289DRAFT_429087 [Coniella lustricola]